MLLLMGLALVISTPNGPGKLINPIIYGMSFTANNQCYRSDLFGWIHYFLGWGKKRKGSWSAEDENHNLFMFGEKDYITDLAI